MAHGGEHPTREERRAAFGLETKTRDERREDLGVPVEKTREERRSEFGLSDEIFQLPLVPPSPVRPASAATGGGGLTPEQRGISEVAVGSPDFASIFSAGLRGQLSQQAISHMLRQIPKQQLAFGEQQTAAGLDPAAGDFLDFFRGKFDLGRFF